MATVAVAELHPTQLYLSAEKLRGVLEWFDVEDPAYGPLPAFRHQGEWYLADGHSRAFVAWLAGAERMPVERDRTVRTDHDFEVYGQCIRWCAEAGVTGVPGLRGRVHGAAAYERRWVQRCRRAAVDG